MCTVCKLHQATLHIHVRTYYAYTQKAFKRCIKLFINQWDTCVAHIDTYKYILQ